MSDSLESGTPDLELHRSGFSKQIKKLRRLQHAPSVQILVRKIPVCKPYGGAVGWVQRSKKRSDWKRLQSGLSPIGLLGRLLRSTQPGGKIHSQGRAKARTGYSLHKRRLGTTTSPSNLVKLQKRLAATSTLNCHQLTCRVVLQDRWLNA